MRVCVCVRACMFVCVYVFLSGIKNVKQGNFVSIYHLTIHCIHDNNRFANSAV